MEWRLWPQFLVCSGFADPIYPVPDDASTSTLKLNDEKETIKNRTECLRGHAAVETKVYLKVVRTRVMYMFLHTQR